MVKKLKNFQRRLNKKAWLRVVEAVIAIIIVSSAILVIFSKTSFKTENFDRIYEREAKILEIISKNDEYRNYVLANNNLEIENIIKKMAPQNWNFTTVICDFDEICSSDKIALDKNIYVNEIIVTSNLTYTPSKPKKLRLFVWLN